MSEQTTEPTRRPSLHDRVAALVAEGGVLHGVLADDPPKVTIHDAVIGVAAESMREVQDARSTRPRTIAQSISQNVARSTKIESDSNRAAAVVAHEERIQRLRDELDALDPEDRERFLNAVDDAEADRIIAGAGDPPEGFEFDIDGDE